MPNVAQTPVKPSAVSLIDTKALARSGEDPYPIFAAAVLTDTGRSLADLADFLPAETFSAVEAYMKVHGVAAVLAAAS